MGDFERLNDINQRIWEQGFTVDNLRDLKILAEDIKNGAAVFERIPQAQQSGLSKGSEILCAAALSVEDVLAQSRRQGRSSIRMTSSARRASKKF